MAKAELIFVPSAGAGHLVSTVEIAKVLVDRDERLDITVFIMKTPFSVKFGSHSTESITNSVASKNRIKFINLPTPETDPTLPPSQTLTSSIEFLKPHIKNIVSELMAADGSKRVVGFVLDMFCTAIIDVATELGVPSYLFFTSGAAFLGFMFHVLALREEHGSVDFTMYKDSPDAELAIPCFANSFPAKLLPTPVLNSEWLSVFLTTVSRFLQVKGVMVNTFLDLESYAIKSIENSPKPYPTLYPVGPILNTKQNIGSDDESVKYEDIIKWLDNQPNASVVFLCFGSMGCFCEEQVKEIAIALEVSGYRFLWSLRQPSPQGKFERPKDYADPEVVLPDGFLERTAHIGRVIGWAPQVAVLAHPAVGGFVSHCGWNSILESVWFGVPMGALPMYAEQQSNAFQLVVELGLAVEIKMEYRNDPRVADSDMIVSAKEIETGIRRLMRNESVEIRKKVKEMSESSRKAVSPGGSSYSSQLRFIEDAIRNVL